MTDVEKGTQPTRLTISFADLTIPDDKKKALEQSAESMADMAAFLGYLDPLDEEPSLVFDPRV